MDEVKMTPMLRQYRWLKERYSDALLFYRLGSFYELFEDDAPIATRELNLAVAVQDGAEVFLRRLVPDGADRSYGLHVARLAVVPEQV
jgi:DNA mismatch repair ATPase MutS